MIEESQASDQNLLTPVERIPTELTGERPDQGVALCLSGGGYRAMLFHVGALWRLNEAGYLPRLNRVSSVSGGSITAARLGLVWRKLAFRDGVAQKFNEEVVTPLRRFAGRTVDVWSVLRGVLGPGAVSDHVIAAYRRHLFGRRTLQDLPSDNEGPRFVINASNLQSGALLRFSRPYAQDYRVGRIPKPAIELAVAVAASSAFPPVLSPVVLRDSALDFQAAPGADLYSPPFTRRVVLTDGGVYDNLGLETAWKRYATVLVSDAGAKMLPQESPARNWLFHSLRVLDLVNDQVRSLRKRQLIASYKLQSEHPDHRDGAYWGIRTNIANYELPDPLPCPFESTVKLAAIATRLGRMDNLTQERLINWGYAVCDAAMRAHVDQTLTRPDDFPYPQAGIG